MRTAIRCLTIALVVLIVSICLLSGPGSAVGADDKALATALPEAQYKALVQRALDSAQKGLQGIQDPATKEKQKKSLLKQARGAAVMIAAYAQQSQTSANAAERAALRDAALRLAATLKEGKYADAQKQLEGLKSPPKPDPKADPKPVDLLQHTDVHEIMKQFSPLLGGVKLERELIRDYLDDSKDKTLPAKALNDDYLALVYQTLVIGELIKNHTPKPKAGKGPRDWAQYNREMQDGLTALAEAVKKKDGKAAFAALNKVDTACVQCHKPFRDADD
jgi:hypothetical protein